MRWEIWMLEVEEHCEAIGSPAMAVIPTPPMASRKEHLLRVLA